MIRVENNVFILETKETSYLFRVMETGHLEHLHYGEKMYLPSGHVEDSVNMLYVKRANLNGCTIMYDKEHPTVSMNDAMLEVSTVGCGDFRSPMVELVFADGSTTSDFVFDSYEVLEAKHMLTTLPSSYDESGNAKTLKVVLKEKFAPVYMELYYNVFEDCDVITRSVNLVNKGEEGLRIERLLSAQLDIRGSKYVMTSFHGDWTKEMGRSDVEIGATEVRNAARTGFSSNQANPFVMLFAKGSSETAGEGYACNLMYSGAHMESAYVSTHSNTRFSTGIHPELFSYKLMPGECFEAPEAVFTYSNGGYEKISKHMHAFVREHVVRGEWKRKVRPVLVNSWEASYFDISEGSLLKLAKVGKEVGAELFVMDDGWFGKRDGDNCSLGDWEVNTKKLPGGVERLSQKIVDLGLMFGIWVEPEMVNEDSDLYRAHPEWAVRHPMRSHCEGRNQMLLDLSREDVQDYLIEAMSKVFSSGQITYVKWDMNRNFSDVYSQALPADRQGEFLHRYIMGLYRIMGTLVERFPHILFEGCASGGNRFDLGILSYMPQIWASDDSDAICRCYIQNGYSYGYPQSVIGAHVSACPNHQTLRNTPIETRFAVAAMGMLGYECNLCEMSRDELAVIKEQIAIYKKWRDVVFGGQFYRLGGHLMGDSLQTDMHDSTNVVEWSIVSPDQEKAIAVMVQEMVKPNNCQLRLRLKGLMPEALYHFAGRTLKFDIRLFGDLINNIAPVHIKKDSLVHNTIAHFVKMDGEVEDYTVTGSVLTSGGVALSQSFAGTGYSQGTRLYQDYDARMYFVEKI